MRNVLRVFETLLLLAMFARAAPGGDLDSLLRSLQAVGPKAAGNRGASAAWAEVMRADAAQLPRILAALDEANPLAANWIRTAVDTIAERQLRAGGRLPVEQLERFVLDRRHGPRGRRLAYEWLCRVDGSAPRRLLPQMVDDPSLELRRDAVAQLIEKAQALASAGQPERAVAIYGRALDSARDADQIKQLAARLGQLGHEVNLTRQFGYVVRWKVIGPFDNTEGRGFDAVYPPEKEIDFRASYTGKQGPVHWIDYVTEKEDGEVDLNQAVGKQKAVAAYAATRFVSHGQQEVEIRIESESAIKLWVNGRLLAAHNVYHSGSRIDQYVNSVVLEDGESTILLKVCQDARPESWAEPWEFHLRVCDHSGRAVLSADRDG